MQSDQFIDVRKLLAESSQEELNRLADEYFAGLASWDYHLAKPFGAADEAPQWLINFAVILQGLKICQGLTVMEFGAGTCWASRFLSQLGCRVIATDVSTTALRIGKELYARQPPIGKQPEPRFLVFDGNHLEVPDESVDRIMCLDAFHHVPNPAHVLKEMARVLKRGGIAGFAEPGPEHSKLAQSQYEMKHHGVIENDINIRSIWKDAQEAGFTRVSLALFNVPPVHLEIQEFEDFLSGGQKMEYWAEATREFLSGQRNFFLYKGEPAKRDSRYRTGLTGEINVAPNAVTVNEGEQITLQARVKNISESVWLPHSAGLGGVHLGCHVYNSDGNRFQESYHWEPLTPGEGRAILPAETVSFEVKVPALPKGIYVLEFDLVSNDVCWFAINGSRQMRISVEVV